MTFVLVSLFLGIIVGVVSSLFGIGGGIFIVPILPSFIDMTHQRPSQPIWPPYSL